THNYQPQLPHHTYHSSRLLTPPCSTLFPYTTLFRSLLKGNSRIVCLPCKEETIRGFSGINLILLDEAARIPDEQDQVDAGEAAEDRKSTRLNSSHVKISYAVFCLKKKNNKFINNILS